MLWFLKKTNYWLSVLGFNIYFDFGEAGKVDDIQISFVDSKTIFFQTPPCQTLIGDYNIRAQIIVTQHDLTIASIDFIYLTRKFLLTDQ